MVAGIQIKVGWSIWVGGFWSRMVSGPLALVKVGVSWRSWLVGVSWRGWVGRCSKSNGLTAARMRMVFFLVLFGIWFSLGMRVSTLQCPPARWCSRVSTSSCGVPCPCAPSQEGDIVDIDVEKHEMNVLISDAEWAARKAAFVPPPLKATSGTLYKYIKNVTSASEGCVTDA